MGREGLHSGQWSHLKVSGFLVTVFFFFVTQLFLAYARVLVLIFRLYEHQKKSEE